MSIWEVVGTCLFCVLMCAWLVREEIELARHENLIRNEYHQLFGLGRFEPPPEPARVCRACIVGWVLLWSVPVALVLLH